MKKHPYLPPPVAILERSVRSNDCRSKKRELRVMSARFVKAE